MEQVAELADQAGGGRARRRTSRRGRQAGVGLEPGDDPGERVGVDGDVGVEEEDERAPSRPGPRRCGPRPGPSGGRVADDRRAERLGQRGRAVGRAVVDDDQLVRRSRAESRSRRRQRPKSRPPLCTGITTESDGLRGPGLAGPAGTSSMIHPRPSEQTRAGMRPRPWDRPSTCPRPPARGGSNASPSGVRLVVLASPGPVAVGRDVRRDFSRNPPGCQRGLSAAAAPDLSESGRRPGPIEVDS